MKNNTLIHFCSSKIMANNPSLQGCIKVCIEIERDAMT